MDSRFVEWETGRAVIRFAGVIRDSELDINICRSYAVT